MKNVKKQTYEFAYLEPISWNQPVLSKEGSLLLRETAEAKTVLELAACQTIH